MIKYRLDADKEKAIYTWAKTALGRDVTTVIWTMQDVWTDQAAMPKLPFVTLNISSGPRRIGYAAQEYDSLDTYKYTFRYAMTLTVNVYSNESNHLGLIESLLQSLELPTKLAILKGEGLAVWTIGDPVDTSALQDTKNEFRATVDIDMSYAKQRTDKVGEIHRVQASGTGDLEGAEIDKQIP